MKQIILDTDLDTDCDDVAALALLHNLQAAGLCKINAVICDAPEEKASLCARIINAYYGYPQIPVGALDISNTKGRDSFRSYFLHRQNCKNAGILYNKSIVKNYQDLLTQSVSAKNAVSVYRKTLATAEDNSINICSIGLLNVLADLMDSEPCNFSNLTGMDLIRRKVNKLVIMGKGNFPTGKDTFNWLMAPHSAAKVLNQWPGQIIISPLGSDILTGKKLLESQDKNPITDAYKIFLKNDGLRPSWDPIAVLFTVGANPEFFSLQSGYTLNYNPISGMHKWEKSPQSNIHLLKQKVSNEALTRTIENLLICPQTQVPCST